MDFQNESQRICYENVSTWLKEIFGEFVMTHSEAPMFAIQKGSAFAEIGVFPWRETDSLISVRAWVVTDADVNEELKDYLLKENNKFLFGGFGLSDDDAIFFQHAIVGSTCDKEELKASVFAVAGVSDDYDDQIISRWGGQSGQDRWRNQNDQA